MPAKPFSQTPPDRANELFDKLLATSDSASKTRERLFSDLKAELELLAGLQEQHLFPILQKHGMQDLLNASMNDNRETISLLNELEQFPKTGGEFLDKVAELRRTFQKHIRDDKNELLPAVLEVLSEEEAQAVAEKVEDEMAIFEETKRAETGSEAHILPKAAEDAADMMHAGTERAQAMTLGVQDLSWECLRMSQRRLQTNLDGWTKFVQCRSMQDVAQVQMSLLQDNLEQTLSNGFRLAGLAAQLAGKAPWNVARLTGRATRHSRDFA